MSKRLAFIIIILGALTSLYYLGPRTGTPLWNPEMPTVPQDPDGLESYVRDHEGQHRVKPDNEARIIWADSTRRKTRYSVVYLHGFYASQKEGDPVHRDFAKMFGCNLYLARMADHGLDTVDQLINFTADRGWQSAKEALAIGKAIGDKVIIMSTSSGGTFALILASDYPSDVSGLINLSPNIRIRHPLAFMANDPWGLNIARLVQGGKYLISPPDSITGKYWYQKFRLEAVPQLQEILEDKMIKTTFRKVTCPSLTVYYYKNEIEQDPTVKVSAMLKMNEELGTADSLKSAVAIPDAGAHVIGSSLVSKDIPGVERVVVSFAVEKLHMKEFSSDGEKR
jgi:pimeloyl-ACP methyl ester carboxylesterase